VSGGQLTMRLGLSKILDPYDLTARLVPGLLVLVPAIFCIAVLYGAKNPIAVALASVLATCGGPYLLSSFVRTWGQRAQERLYRQWGGQPTTLLLRHGQDHLPPQTKQRYRELAASRLGIELPNPDAEASDPVSADHAFAAAADALRPLTNDKRAFPFVFKELVAYGFNRNAYGSRWIGLGVSLATILFASAHADLVQVQSPYWAPKALEPSHAAVMMVAAIFACLWCFHFTASTVKQAGFSYAKRLWEALEKLPRRPTRAQPKRLEPAMPADR
jgi:hypothetical protein